MAEIDRMAARNHNIIILMEPNEFPWKNPMKIGYSFMNRFTIDENSGFELLKVLELRQVTERLNKPMALVEKKEYLIHRQERWEKGKEFKDTPTICFLVEMWSEVIIRAFCLTLNHF